MDIDEEQERMNIAQARYLICVNGTLLPVIEFFGMWGDRIRNPLLAFRVVAYNRDSDDPKGCYEIWECKPGDLYPYRPDPPSRLH